MRRIASACLLQTIRFESVNGSDVEEEFQIYCRKMNRKKVRYAVDEVLKESDGSLIVKIRKQYNTYLTDGYIMEKEKSDV
jgi:hypothetical protein